MHTARSTSRRIIAAAIAASFTLTPLALAAPKGAAVRSGKATIEQSGDTTTITVGRRAIIDYQSFDIAPGETVRFIQPSATSRVLNRVESGDPTRIDGSLIANGRVYLVNPAGVYFGSSAVVDVAAITAAAGTITDRDFLRGVDRFTGLSGAVLNEGSIEAQAVALIGRRVENVGSIVAPDGFITMAAGDSVYLSERGGRIMVRIDNPAAATGGATQPVSTDAGVSNSGTLDAGPHGAVTLSAGDLYSLAVNQGSHIRGRSVIVQGGDGSTVEVAGTIDASSAAPGERGGSVHITGGSVALRDAHIDASGHAGGGEVLIGGAFQGGDALPAARYAFVDASSVIVADAINAGDGGLIVVWSDVATGFAGSASARGGVLGGDGGLIETSGRRFLGVDGALIDASARSAGGAMGMWLLDPTDARVKSAPVDTASLPILFATPDSAADGNGSNLSINATTLNAATANVLIQADRDVIFDAAVSMLNNGIGITAQAGRHVIVNAPITTRGGTIRFTANDNSHGTADGAGGIDLNAPLDTTGGGIRTGSVILTVAGGSGAVTLGADITASNALTFDAPVVLTPVDPFTTNAIILDVTGRPGIRFSQTLESGGIGDVDLTMTVNPPALGPAGDILFNGVVGGVDGAARLGQVTIHDARNVTADADFFATGFRQNSGSENTTFRGLLSTAGQGTDGESGGDLYIRIDRDILLTNVDTSGADNAAGDGGDAGHVTLLPEDGAGTLDKEDAPDGMIYLLSSNKTPVDGRPTGSITALGGEGTTGDGADGIVRLNVDPVLGTDGRTRVPVVATVSGTRSAGSDYVIEAGELVMGQNEKATFFGHLTVVTSGDTTIADVNTLGDLSITVGAGSDIFIKSRQADDLFQADVTKQFDAGVDYVIGRRADFSNVPIVLGGGAAPTFASPGGVRDVRGTLVGFVRRDYGVLPFTLLTLGGLSSGLTLDLATRGPSDSNLAEALAGAAPDLLQSGRVPTDTEIGKVHKQMLEELGIITRDLTPIELVWMLSNRRFFNDLNNRVAPDARVVANQRLLYTPVEQVILAYRDLFFERVTEGPDGERVGVQPRRDAMKQAMTEALAAYHAQSGGGDFDPAAFSAFVAAHPEHAEALRTLDGLRDLYAKIANLALTPNEVAASKLRVYGYVLPDGMNTPQLDAAVNAPR